MRSSVRLASSTLALAFIVGCSAESFVGTSTPKDPPNVGGGGDAGTGDAGDGGAVAPDSGIDAALPPGCDAAKLPADDACVIDEASGVFVSAQTGSVSGDGSRLKPLATIGAAIITATSTKKRVYVCEGSYAESVVLANGVAMFGGFDCTTWSWNANGRAKIASPTSPAMRASAIALDTRVEGFDVVAPAGTPSASSSIGFIAVNSPAVRFIHGSITAGAGFAGVAGVDATQLTNGPWIDGDANVDDIVCGGSVMCETAHAFRSGGVNACVGKQGFKGGDGGGGGSGGIFTRNPISGFSVVAAQTSGGATVATSTTAAGGTGSSATQPGSAGGAGASGGNGAPIGTFSASGYTPSDGSAAVDGTPGQGGGGGAGYGVPSSRFNNYVSGAKVYGIPGSGGGAGGCPGLAGTPGTGGGASVALVAVDSPMRLEDSKLTASTGGDGGAAGISTVGTAGGTRGGNASISSFGYANFLGANGGSGGNGGLAGQGAGGPSIGFAYHGTAPTLLATTVKNAAGGKGAPSKNTPAGTIIGAPDGFANDKVAY